MAIWPNFRTILWLVKQSGSFQYGSSCWILAWVEVMFLVGLSRVTDYPWAVRFLVVTGYKFTNRLTGSCTDDLLETWSCQNHEKVDETLVNPSYIWAKMRLLSVFGPLTGPREPVSWHFLPLEVASGHVPPGGGIESMVLNKRWSFSQESEFMKLRTISSFLCHQMTAFRWIIIIT